MLRKMKKLANHLLANGLPGTNVSESTGAIAVLLKEKLCEEGNNNSASQAAEIIQKLFDTSIKKNPEEIQLACEKNCSYCCHEYVTATAPEVFSIAQVLRQNGHQRSLEDIIGRTNKTVGLDETSRTLNRTHCTLLRDSLCTVYYARPMACRRYVSSSLDSCVAKYRGEGDRVLMPKLHTKFSSICLIALYGALASCLLPNCAYELSGALQVVLSEENSEARWLKGEDIFVHVHRDETLAPEMQKLVRILSNELSELFGTH